MEIKDLINYLEEETPAGTNMRIVLPYEKATIIVDELSEELYLYLKEHRFCSDSSFDYIEDGVIHNAALTFIVSGQEQFYHTT